eukprot:m.13846 g.13846  ORF g.13846 m.13846 type:complete len:265 (+) comp4937_c0_seq2:262-1056(+)
MNKKSRRHSEKSGSLHSPSLMRKAEADATGKYASVAMVEDAVRAVEGGVKKELEADKKYMLRMDKVSQATQTISSNSSSQQSLLQDAEERLEKLKGNKEFQSNNEALFRKANIARANVGSLYNTVLSREDISVLKDNMEEAQKICESLKGLGGARSSILDHALNGLANAKVSQASGEVPRPEVFQKLFALLHDTQSMEVAHGNAQVRLNHCLRVCEGILNKQPKKELVEEFHTLVCTLEKKAEASNISKATETETEIVVEEAVS